MAKRAARPRPDRPGRGARASRFGGSGARRWRPPVLGVAASLAMVFALAACGSSTPSSKSTTSTSPAASKPSLTVSPSTGLSSGQTVKVSATGFKPKESLVVIECANVGKNTGPGDCNLPKAKYLKSDSSGSLTAQLQVTKGPFGSKHIVCKTSTSCLVSVAQPSPTPSQEATAIISFG